MVVYGLLRICLVVREMVFGLKVVGDEVLIYEKIIFMSYKGILVLLLCV